MSKPVNYHDGGFPPNDLDWTQLIRLIGPASAALARFDGVLSAIPNASVLLSPLTTQEAVLSSRIEGTQATMGEVLEYEAEGERGQIPNKRIGDIHEILNYRRAMKVSVNLMQEMPLSLRIIREAHQVLMQGVRGSHSSPGEYRKIPNWIGPPGCKIEEARFIPIEAQKLPDALSKWERYIHDDEATDRLIQLAILHAEFEALHPFLDGNGRLGRMLIPLFLFHARLIQSPMFYISAYFEKNRDEYYHRLLTVSSDGDWTGWCRFFLEAVRSQADDNLIKANQILTLYNGMKATLVEAMRSQFAIHALDWIFDKPIFKSSDFVNQAGIPKATAKRLLIVLRNENILKEISPSSGPKSAIFGFAQLLNIAEGRAVL